MRIWVLALCGMGLLAGCGDNRPPEKTVFEPMLETKQKARDVERTLQDSAQQRKEQLESER
jgi:hypothetical protein